MERLVQISEFFTFVHPSVYSKPRHTNEPAGWLTSYVSGRRKTRALSKLQQLAIGLHAPRRYCPVVMTITKGLIPHRGGRFKTQAGVEVCSPTVTLHLVIRGVPAVFALTRLTYGARENQHSARC